MATAKQFTEKIVVADKLVLGNFAPIKGVPASELIITDHLLDGVVIDHSDNSEVVVSEVTASNQPLLMAKADIEMGEPASGAVVSDADISYTDHITSEVAEAVSEQPELVALNTVQHLTDSAVLAEENAAGGGGIPWMWVGAAAVAGGGLGVALGANHGGNDAAPAATVDPTVHVVVEREGAFIDANNNDAKDDNESYLSASSGLVEGDASLNDHHVVVHFNDVPLDAINLNGFGTDDKIQFDVTSFQDYKLLNASQNSITSLETNDAAGSRYTYFSFAGDPSITLFRDPLTGKAPDFNNVSHHSMYALQASSMETKVNGHHTGVIAYWSKASNPLNDQHNILPNFTGSNTDRVVGNLNAGTEGGLVEFVNFPEQDHVYVIVNDSCHSYIDQDHNGILNSADYVAGATYESAVFSGHGNADLADHAVTIHFHNNDGGGPDLTGFTANDRIEIDMDRYFGFDGRHSRTTQIQHIAKTATSGSSLIYASTVDIHGHNPYNSACISSSYYNIDDATMIRAGLRSAGGEVTNLETIAHFHEGYNPVSHGNVDFIYSSNPVIPLS